MKKIFNFIMVAICTLLVVTGCSVNSTKEFSIGSWDGNTYTNDFLGLTYNMPEDWTRTSDEELKGLIEEASDLIEISEYEKKLAEIKAVYYLMAKSSNGSNAILGSEKVISGTSEVKYAKTLKTQLESQNLGYILSDATIETIDGKEFVTLEAEISSIKQKYYIYKIDNYIIYLCITGFSTEEVNEIFGQFQFN